MTKEEFHAECPYMADASIKDCVRMMMADEGFAGETVFMGHSELVFRGLMRDDSGFCEL